MIKLGKIEEVLELFKKGKTEDWNGKIFLAVVHVLSGSAMFESALAGAITAFENGADGVLLIDMRGGSHDQLTSVAIRVMAYFKSLGVDFPVGVNYLDLTDDPEHAVFNAALAKIPMLWTDSSEGKEEVKAARKRYGWKGLYMGAFAFKYKDEVSLQDLPRVARNSMWMDVSVTSGEATGQPIDPNKARIAAESTPGQPRGIASGVSVTNVRSLLSCGFMVIIAASSILDKDGNLDPKKTRELADYIHGWNP